MDRVPVARAVKGQQVLEGHRPRVPRQRRLALPSVGAPWPASVLPRPSPPPLREPSVLLKLGMAHAPFTQFTMQSSVEAAEAGGCQKIADAAAREAVAQRAKRIDFSLFMMVLP